MVPLLIIPFPLDLYTSQFSFAHHSTIDIWSRLSLAESHKSLPVHHSSRRRSNYNRLLRTYRYHSPISLHYTNRPFARLFYPSSMPVPSFIDPPSCLSELLNRSTLFHPCHLNLHISPRQPNMIILLNYPLRPIRPQPDSNPDKSSHPHLTIPSAPDVIISTICPHLSARLINPARVVPINSVPF